MESLVVFTGFCRNLRSYITFLIVTLILLGGAGAAYAKPVPFKSNSEATYQLKNDLLVTFLKRFLGDQGLRVVLSEALSSDKRKLNGIRQGSPSKIFNSIVNSNGLVSYFDGITVYLYKAEEVRREFLVISDKKTQLLRQMLKKMRLSDAENYARVDVSTGLVEISGVPRYVDQVQRLVNVLADRNETKEMAFHYIPLKYAWASDRVFTVGSQQVNVAGVATVLRQAIYGGGEAAGARNEKTMSASAGSLQGKGLAARNEDAEGGARVITLSGKNDLQISADRASNDQTSSSLMGLGSDNGSGPGIVADTQHNAIIIRDLPSRIPLYKELVKALDVPSPIIEIEATIIDVDTTKLLNKGVEWRFSKDEGRGEVVFSKDGNKQNLVDTLTGGSMQLLDQTSGFQVGAIIGDKNQFITRINALQNDGIVTVTSRPKVATLNDMEAVIESSRSLYVPIEGAFEADLFQVFSGTVLRVTPHVIDTEDQKQIRLIVAVEDGTVDVLQDSETPVSTRHAVTTQAVIDSGYSLLLGGLIRDKEVTSTSKVPLLGDIPLIGELFKSESKDRQNAERLFLISPRIKSTDGSGDRLSTLALEKTASLSNGKPEKQEIINKPFCQTDCREELSRERLRVF